MYMYLRRITQRAKFPFSTAVQKLSQQLPQELYICPIFVVGRSKDFNFSIFFSSCMRLLGHAVVPANFLVCRMLGDAI
jgi:hypothetical protein